MFMVKVIPSKLAVVALLFFLSHDLFASGAGDTTQNGVKPNIVVILGNDLGIGSLGIYGQQKIKTPNIDALARQGVRFSNFYTGSPSDAPSLAILLTGKHAGKAAIRGTDEWAERGSVNNYVKVLMDSTLEGQRPLPAGEQTIADLLRTKGYATGLFGQWGLGSIFSEGAPLKHGFDTFYGYACLRQAQTYYPKYLWRDSRKVSLDNSLVFPNMKLANGADPRSADSYQKYTLDSYAPDSILAASIKFIEDNGRKPFFMVYASPLAQGPLQVPASSALKEYQREFLDDEPYLAFFGGYPNRTPRATYAAMVTYFDMQVGKLVEKLKEKGLFENTLIVFASDNGVSSTNGIDVRFFESAGKYAVGNGRGKGYLFESGIRVPFFAVWPNAIDTNRVVEQQAISYDILPTITELVGIEKPAYADGVSLLPTLLGKGEQAQHDYLYWEIADNTAHQAIIRGQWKLVGKNMSFQEPTFELYNLSVDPTETTDVAEENPALVCELRDLMEKVRTAPTLSSFKIKFLRDN
jgi:arylsulfatase